MAFLRPYAICHGASSVNVVWSRANRIVTGQSLPSCCVIFLCWDRCRLNWLPAGRLAKKKDKMAGVFEVYVKTHFSAAHSLKGYPGDCARIHGHNWIVEVFVRCKRLDEIGIGIDFRGIKQAVKDVLEGLDHFNLNELQVFKHMNPSSENIAKFLYNELAEKLNSDVVRVSRVKVCETPEAGVFYWEE